MRRLILVAALGLALPAFAADEHAPAIDPPAPDEASATIETASEQATPEATESESAVAEAAPAAADTAPAPLPVPSEAVARGTFATAIEQREPADSIDSLESDAGRVYYFTELVGIDGRRVTHRWEYGGEVVAEVPIEVGGPRWRAYSSKNLDASQLGEWTVAVVDETGHVVHTDRFTYEAPAPMPAAPAPPAAPSASEASAQAPAAPAAAEASDPEPPSPSAAQP